MAQVEQVKTTEEEANPFETASWLSKLFFFWMTPIVKLGTTRVLTEEDVPRAPDVNSSVRTVEKLRKCWEQELRQHPHDPSLLRTIYRANSRRMTYSLGNFLIFMTVTFLQPYLVSRILTYVTTGDAAVFGIESSIAAALFLGLSATIGALVFNQGFYHMQQFGLTTRTALIGLLFQKSINVSNTARQTYTAGEIITLMSVDVERIWLGILLSNWIIMAPPMLIAAIVLLWFQVGYASLVVAGALIGWGYFQEVVSDWIGQTRRKFVKHTAERAKRMNEILQGIRVVKLYAWEEATEARINDVRSEELTNLSEYLNIRMMNTILQFLGPVAVAFILFMTYSGMGGEFGVKKAYTCMAILNITRVPIALFPMARSAFQEAVNSIERIRSYLITPDMQRLVNAKTIMPHARPTPSSNQEVNTNMPLEKDLEMVDIEISENGDRIVAPVQVLISLKHCSFNWAEIDTTDSAAGSYDVEHDSAPVEDAAEALIDNSFTCPAVRSRSLSNEVGASPDSRDRTTSSDFQIIEIPSIDITDENQSGVNASATSLNNTLGQRPASPFGPCSLNDVTLDICKGDLVAIVGSVGTG